MKYTNEETPTVTVKRKNISQLVEYCIDNKIEFSVKPLISRSEEFELEFNISNSKKAIALGMCLKELRLELNGMQAAVVAPVKTSKKASVKENGHSKEENSNPLSFEEEKLEFSLESTTN